MSGETPCLRCEELAKRLQQIDAICAVEELIGLPKPALTLRTLRDIASPPVALDRHDATEGTKP